MKIGDLVRHKYAREFVGCVKELSETKAYVVWFVKVSRSPWLGPQCDLVVIS